MFSVRAKLAYLNSLFLSDRWVRATWKLRKITKYVFVNLVSDAFNDHFTQHTILSNDACEYVSQTCAGTIFLARTAETKLIGVSSAIKYKKCDINSYHMQPGKLQLILWSLY